MAPSVLMGNPEPVPVPPLPLALKIVEEAMPLLLVLLTVGIPEMLASVLVVVDTAEVEVLVVEVIVLKMVELLVEVVIVEKEVGSKVMEVLVVGGRMVGRTTGSEVVVAFVEEETVELVLKLVKGGMKEVVVLEKTGASVIVDEPPVPVAEAVVLAGTDVGATVVFDVKVVVGTS
jgi:hypothetical protein